MRLAAPSRVEQWRIEPFIDGAYRPSGARKACGFGAELGRHGLASHSTLEAITSLGS